MASKRFVCVINRNRDEYEVPLALEEAGLLERFVTDFYAGPEASSILPRMLRRRGKRGLAASKVTSSLTSFAAQLWGIVTRRDMGAVFVWSDRMLARKGAQVAKATGANLYCYAGYIPEAREIPRTCKLIDFEFHPHPDLEIAILREDAARHPGIAFERSASDDGDLLERYRDGFRRADAIVCASDYTRRSLIAAGCDAAAITVIPYGAEPPTAAVAPRAHGPCRFLFVGQGLQRKGLHHLILAWQRLAPRDAQLTIVCYAIDPAIRALVDSPSIRLLGRQSRAELDALYATSDVFAMPSLVEGFGLVYLEALRAGCHVIATRNTGMATFPLDDAALTLIEPGDVDDLAAAIARLVEAKRDGRIDAAAIAEQTRRWSWRDFRRAIAAHARAVSAA